MKVVHVITGLHVGGAETMLLKLLGAMDRSRFEAAVVSLMPGGEIRARIRALGIPVHDLAMGRGIPSLGEVLALRRLARELEPDLIQGWMYHGNLAGLLLGVFAPGKPRLLWNIRHSIMDMGREKPLTRMVIRLGSLLGRAPDRIIFNSGQSLEQHAGLGYPREKSLMIPNGFDLDLFRPDPEAAVRLRAELHLGPEAVLVGMAARRHPMKGHEEFLAAASRLPAGDRDVHFVLAGRGVTADDPVLGDLAGAPDLAGRVHLLGQRRDMPSFFAGLDLLCVPSLYGEGFPNVLGEAMACGVPCVATDVGESREILAGTGRIVAPGDPAALAREMGELLDLPERISGDLPRRCRTRIRDDYSLAGICERYADLYLSA